MNNHNLIPIKKGQRSREEVVRVSRKGGINSGEARRNKRDLKQKFQIAIDLLSAQSLKTLQDEDSKKLLQETDVLVYNLFNIIHNKKIKKETVLKATNMVWDRMYGKPDQHTNNTNTNVNTEVDLSNVPTENLEAIVELTPEQLSNLVIQQMSVKKPKSKDKAKSKSKHK